MNLKKCVTHKSVLEDNVYKYLLQKKHQLLHLRHNYCKVLYETHSGKFSQQLMKVKGFIYFEHSIQSMHNIKNCMAFSQVLVNGWITCIHYGRGPQILQKKLSAISKTQVSEEWHKGSSIPEI